MTLKFYKDKHKNPTFVEFIESADHTEEVTRFYWRESPSDPFIYCWMLPRQRNRITSLPVKTEILTLYSPYDANYDSKNKFSLGPGTRYRVIDAITNKNFTVVKLQLIPI